MARALTALTIGPLDPLGRDGVLADVRAFSALGLHATAVVTAVGPIALSASQVATQLDAVFSSVRVDTVKLACPGDAAVLEAIAEVLARHDVQTLVLDPAEATFDAASLAVLKTRLLPRALVAVLDVDEARALTGLALETWEDMRDAARAIVAMGPANVVIKGAQRTDAQVTDLLFDGADYRDYTAERAELAGVPGTGATFAAAVAATLAKGEIVQHAIAAGKAYVTKALQDTYDLGGVPALHHFYRYWRPSAPAPQ